jgi:hypothetical protein
MSNLDNLSPRELLYRAYDEIHREELEAEKKRQKKQPVVPLKDGDTKEKTAMDYFREAYAEKEDAE